ncbi:MAG: ABC transporter ATP-binding protein, partial [Leptospiraceae bacterium]|nr:ABC transporter ATP-binding protein [Leptospiraceae bacterium]
MRALRMVYQSGALILLLMVAVIVITGVTPAFAAYVGKRVVDAVVHLLRSDFPFGRSQAYFFVALEVVLILILLGARRLHAALSHLMRGRLQLTVTQNILKKALRLDAIQFENPQLLDVLQRARAEAATRPLNLMQRLAQLARSLILLSSYGFLLFQFSGWALLVLIAASLPAFIAELRYSGGAFKERNLRAQDKRVTSYLSTILTREDFVRELKVYRLGQRLLERFVGIHRNILKRDRRLVVWHAFWSILLNALATLVFAGAYFWIVYETIEGNLSLGDMTMYLVIFRQGQNTVMQALEASGGLYDDYLYLTNLFAFLDWPVSTDDGERESGERPGDGLRLEQVGFTYPDATRPAVHNVNLHIPPGCMLAVVGENGSGKTTLIKLLMRLLEPSSGRITLDGTPLSEWKRERLYERFGVVFQDFMR